VHVTRIEHASWQNVWGFDEACRAEICIAQGGSPGTCANFPLRKVAHGVKCEIFITSSLRGDVIERGVTMPRIVGVDIPDNKRLEVSLTYIFGVGVPRSKEIISKLHLNPDMRAHQLSADDIAKINSLLQSEYTVEGDLKRQVQNNIKRLISIHSYRGMRHRLGLPVHGQRTRTNARTRKGPRKTVAGKKKAPQQ